MLKALTHMKCRECGEQISVQAKFCQHCAAKVTMPTISKVVLAFIVLVLAWQIFKSDDEKVSVESKSTSPAVAQTPVKHPFKAEDIVTFPKSTIACLSRDSLELVLQHSILGEETKARAMMTDNGGDCLMLDPAKKYRFIHVEYNDPNQPDFGLAEVVGANIKSSDKGAWTLTLTAQLSN